jgi:hypothetical protein
MVDPLWLMLDLMRRLMGLFTQSQDKALKVLIGLMKFSKFITRNVQVLVSNPSNGTLL